MGAKKQASGSAPSNEIWYTTKSNTVCQPYSASAINANVVSNTYDSGKGVIVFDAPVTTIGAQAFYSKTDLKSITLPQSLTTIGDQAFRNCTALETISIPDSVMSVGAYAFRQCVALSKFEGNLASSDGKCLIVGNSLAGFAQSGITTYSLPDGITGIDGYVFYQNTQIKSLTIPASVTQIGAHSFSMCSNLSELRFLGATAPTPNKASFGNSTTTYVGYTTAHTAKNVIYVPEGSLSSYQANYYKSVLQAASCCGFTLIPYEKRNRYIRYVSTDAAAVSLYSGTSVSNVYGSEGAAHGRMEMSADITKIADQAFYGKSTLKYVQVPETVTWYGSRSFYNCTSLIEAGLYLADNATGYIGASCFRYCSSMQVFYLKSKIVFSVGDSNVFSSTASGFTVYVPADMVDKFKASSQWSKYNIQPYTF